MVILTVIHKLIKTHMLSIICYPLFVPCFDNAYETAAEWETGIGIRFYCSCQLTIGHTCLFQAQAKMHVSVSQIAHFCVMYGHLDIYGTPKVTTYQPNKI